MDFCRRGLNLLRRTEYLAILVCQTGLISRDGYISNGTVGRTSVAMTFLMNLVDTHLTADSCMRHHSLSCSGVYS